MKLNKLHDKLIQAGFKETPLSGDKLCYEARVNKLWDIEDQDILSIEISYDFPLFTIEFGMTEVLRSDMSDIGTLLSHGNFYFNTSDKDFDNLDEILRFSKQLFDFQQNIA